MQPKASDQHIHYMGHLRSLFIICVLIHHANASYAPPIPYQWFVKHNPTTDILLVIRTLFYDLGTPLFYLASGFFSYLLIQKRGVLSFLKNRTTRVFIPFVVFVFVTYYALYGVYLFGVSYLGDTVHTYLHLEKKSGSFSTYHLWFLRYLFELYLLCLLVQWIEFPSIIKKIRDTAFSSPLFLLVIPLLMVPGDYIAPELFTAPVELRPQLWAYLYFGAFFCLGWHFFPNQNFIQIIYSHLGKLILAASILFALQVFIIFDNLDGHGLQISKFIDAIYSSYLNCYLVFIALGISHRFLNKENKKMHYISEASYWSYLIHLPIIYIFQILLAPLTFSLWWKFLIVLSATLAITTTSHHLFVSYTPIGWILNGKRKKFHRLTRQKIQYPTT